MITDINEATFKEEVTGKKDISVVDFFASWCAPCKMMIPVLEQLASEYLGKVKFFKFNIEDSIDITSSCSINAVPTLLIFNKGEIADRLVGSQTKDNIAKKINSILDKTT